MQWAEHAWHWFSHLPFWAQLATYFGGTGGVLVAVCMRIVKRGALAFAKAWVESEGGRMTTDDAPTAQHRLPSSYETDTALERHYRDGLLRCEQEREAANEARRLAEAQARALLAKTQEQEAEILSLRGDRESLQYELAKAQALGLQLRKEVAELRGVDPDRELPPPAPRTPGSYTGLPPVTGRPPPTPLVLEPARPLDELRDTPPGGSPGVRARREP